MTGIYCHGKTLRNALRAVWLEVGKALFGQVATGAQDAGGVDAGAAAASDNGSAVRWESRAARRCRHHPSETTLPGGVDVIRTKGGKAPFSENGLCVLNGWDGCGHLLLVLC